MLLQKDSVVNYRHREAIGLSRFLFTSKNDALNYPERGNRVIDSSSERNRWYLNENIDLLWDIDCFSKKEGQRLTFTYID